MKHFFICMLWALLCLGGCVPKSGPQDWAGKVEVVQSRTVQMQHTADIRPVVAVVVRDNAKVADLQQFMEDALRARGYEVTENPSLAGYIVQLNAIHAGPMDPDTVRRSVPQGYGVKISGGGGQGAMVFMVDVLVVMRTQPKAVQGRPRIIASTATNTRVDDEELRVAALLRGGKLVESVVLPELEKAVVQVVAGVLPVPRRGADGGAAR